MIYTDMTKKAIKIMYQCHKDQVDKAGIPYVLHPLHVAEKMMDENRTIVALLHDVVEDANITLDKLSKEGFSIEILDALNLLTHDPNVDYYDYIQKIGNNEIATDVKIADLEHNSDLTRLNKITDWDLIRTQKYKKCIEYLKNIKYNSQNEKVSFNR